MAWQTDQSGLLTVHYGSPMYFHFLSLLCSHSWVTERYSSTFKHTICINTKYFYFSLLIIFLICSIQVVWRNELSSSRWRGGRHKNDSLWIPHMVTPPNKHTHLNTSHHVTMDASSHQLSCLQKRRCNARMRKKNIVGDEMEGGALVHPHNCSEFINFGIHWLSSFIHCSHHQVHWQQKSTAEERLSFEVGQDSPPACYKFSSSKHFGQGQWICVMTKTQLRGD